MTIPTIADTARKGFSLKASAIYSTICFSISVVAQVQIRQLPQRLREQQTQSRPRQHCYPARDDPQETVGYTYILLAPLQG